MVETYDGAKADETCSRPGHSEHTTGLGLDGFILRYPKDKEDLTGYYYESWHIRYVGKDLAKKVEKSQLTFDEYYARHY